MNIAKPIHNGDNTHNQDHVITLHNLRVINNRHNKAPKPMPSELDLLLLMGTKFIFYD